MPDTKDYLSNVYSTLKESVEGFDKDEASFRSAMQDSEYSSKVYSALKETVDGFNKTPEEFTNALVLKKKDQTEISSANSKEPASPEPQESSSTSGGLMTQLTSGVNKALEQKLPSDSSTSESADGSLDSTKTPKFEMPTEALPATKENPRVEKITKKEIIQQHVANIKADIEKDYMETDAAYEDIKQRISPFVEVLNNPMADPLQKQYAQSQLQELAPEIKQVEDKKEAYAKSYHDYINDVNGSARSLQFIADQHASYLEGAGKSIAHGTADILDAMQGANDFVNKYAIGWDTKGIKNYSFLADHLRSGAENNLENMPDNLGGKILGGAAGSIPLIAATFLAPETAIPKFATTMGAVAFGKSYHEDGDVLNAVKAGGYGLAEGAILHGLGVAGTTVGKWAAKTKVGQTVGEDLTGTTAAALVTSLGFGGQDAAKQFLNTGKINMEDVAASIGVGLAFSVSGIAKASYEKAFVKSVTTSPEIVGQAIDVKKDAIELRDKAAEILSEAVGKSPEEKAKAFLISKSLNDVADMKALGQDIADNPSKYITDVKQSDWTPEQKKDAIANINTLVEQNNKNFKEAAPLKQEKEVLKSEFDSAQEIADPDYRDSEMNRIQEEIDAKQVEIDAILNKTTPVVDKKDQIKPKPTKAQIAEDVENGKMVTFEYDRESDIPEALKDRITSSRKVDGKDNFKIKITKSEADYLLHDSSNLINKPNEKASKESGSSSEKGSASKESSTKEEIISSAESDVAKEVPTGAEPIPSVAPEGVTEVSKPKKEQTKEELIAEHATSTTKEGVKERRKLLSLEPLEKQVAHEIGADWDKTKEAVDSGEMNVEQIADNILNDKAAATPEQKLALGYEMMKAEEDFEQASDALTKAKEIGNEVVIDLAKSSYEFAEAKLKRWHEVNDKSQTQWGRFGRYSQEFIKRDRTIARAKLRLSAAEKIDPKSKEAIAAKEEIVKLHKEYTEKKDEYEKQLKSVQEKIEEANKKYDKTFKDTDANKSLRRKSILFEAAAKKEGTKVKIALIDGKISDVYENIRNLAKEQRKKISANPIPVEIIPELAKLVDLYARKGVINLMQIVDDIYLKLKEVYPDVTHQNVYDEVIGGPLNMEKEIPKYQEQKAKNDLDKQYEKVERSLNRSIDEYEKKLKSGDFSGKKKADKPPLTEKLKELKDKKEELAKEVKIAKDIQFDQEKAWDKVQGVIDERISDNRTKMQKLASGARNVVFGVMRPVMTGIDLSAMGAQGALMSAGNPTKVPAAVHRMISNAFSEKSAERFMYDIKKSPDYKYIKMSDLFLSDAKHAEESFETNIVEKIPLVGSVIKGSSRAYSGYMNKLRVDIFASRIQKLLSEGKTLENNLSDFKAEASAINKMSGRGNLGGLEKSAKTLNTVLFSARNIAAQFQVLGLSDVAMAAGLKKGFYGNLTPSARKLVAKNLVSFVGTGLATIMLLDTNDDVEVEWDPRSTDFLKIKVGNTRVSPFGGYQTMAVATVKMLTMHRKNNDTKKINFVSPIETLGTTLRYKESPETSMVHDWISGQSEGGNITDTKNAISQEMSLGEALLNRLTPMSASTIWDVYKDAGAKTATGLAPFAIVGFGMNTYGTHKKEDKKLTTQKERKAKLQERMNKLKK